MNRRFVAALVLALTAFGFAVADEFQAHITKVQDARLTYKRVKGFNEENKLEYDEEKTLPTTKDVKVVKARYDKEARKIVNGDALEGGLKNDAFKDLGKDKKKGVAVLATLMTDAENKKITQIRVLSLKIKIKDKEAK
jgi:hypothetical protein